MTQSAYIHIPFCKSKCNYCSFVSFPKLENIEQYVCSLVNQIKTEYRSERLNTVYFGGGTPSLLSLEQLKSVVSMFEYASDAELTIEVNPDGLSSDFLIGLKSLGFNRLSIGVQTFESDVLKLIGRSHSPEQVVSTLNRAQNAGFDNISLDFIYGLPKQNTDLFIKDLKKALSMNIQHISLYGLKIEEGCVFYNNPPANIADLDSQADMFVEAINLLTSAGFIHYEVSNFSKPGFESRHNLNYWNNENYYGFGCAASGYLQDTRYTNLLALQDYIKNPLSKESEHVLTAQEKLEESIFLGFRKINGINIDELNIKYSIDFNDKYKCIIDKYSDFLVKTNKGWKLNNDGILVSNEILAEFIEC